MQVFLPHPSFAHSVAVLDRARLGKQRIECRQILTALRALRSERKVGWSSHPATLMWVGHESALAVYFTLAIREWEARGYNNTMIPPYDADWRRSAGEDPHLDEDGRSAVVPAWLGREDIHSSHRANLLRKDAEYYFKFGWQELPAEGYVWPVREGETA